MDIDREEKYTNDMTNSKVSKENLPSLKKILVLYDGTNKSNKVFNHATFFSKFFGAEIIILRILENIDTVKNITIESTLREKGKIDTKDIRRMVEKEIIEDIQEKIDKCKGVGGEGKISYRFRTNDNIVDEIIKDIKEESYDLIILTSSNIDSWTKSIISETRKIASKTDLPILIIQ